jgi:RNA polymerase sigma factor (sigma-70 family)
MDLDELFSGSVDDRIDMERAIGRLNYREAAVLYLWTMCEYSQAEVADIIGLSQQRISQILSNISKKS